LYAQEIPLPAKASVNEAKLYDKPFLPLVEPPVLGVELTVEEEDAMVALAALEAEAEPEMVAKVVGMTDNTDDKTPAAEDEAPESEKEYPPPFDGLP